MQEIDISQKEMIKSFIDKNDLDLMIVDNGFFKFKVVAMDKVEFSFYIKDKSFILVKYDQSKDISDILSEEPHTYSQFNNIQQMLEQIKLYDDSLSKSWWSPVSDVTQLGTNIDTYDENWFEFIIGQKFSKVDGGRNITYLSYTSKEYRPELKSLYNTLHEVSEINNLEYTTVEGLNIEIHPLNCMDKNESYLFKVQCNNEEVLKEYINFVVYKKKGLKKLVKETFDTMENYKIKR